MQVLVLIAAIKIQIPVVITCGVSGVSYLLSWQIEAFCEISNQKRIIKEIVFFISPRVLDGMAPTFHIVDYLWILVQKTLSL